MFKSRLLRCNVLKLRTTSSLSATKACNRPLFILSNRLNFAPDTVTPGRMGLSNFIRKAQLCTVSITSKVDEIETAGVQEETFKQLLKNSQFVKSIDPVGRVVDGEIIAVSGGKVYVDFGSKFHGVVPLPKENSNQYIEGAKVMILIKDLEMTDHFLGAKKHISLLEANIELVGLAAKPSS